MQKANFTNQLRVENVTDFGSGHFNPVALSLSSSPSRVSSQTNNVRLHQPTMAVTQQDMDQVEHWFFMPLVTIVNFALFQYLVAMYYRRRYEARVALLLCCAFVGFAVIIP